MAEPLGALVHTRPTAPTLWFSYREQSYALQLVSLDIHAEIHAATAFIELVGQWRNINAETLNCLFALPLSGNVTSVSIKIGKERLVETLMVSNNDAQDIRREVAKYQERKAGKEMVPPGPAFDEQYIPNLFRLPVPAVGGGEDVLVKVKFTEPLDFFDGQYNLMLPLTFLPGVLPPECLIEDVVSIHCTVFNPLKGPAVPPLQFNSTSHRIEVQQQTPECAELQLLHIESDADDHAVGALEAGGTELANLGNQTGKDLHVAYTMVSSTILGTLILEKEERSEEQQQAEEDEMGNFVLFISPPSIDNVGGFFAREIVFLLDRSGSMVGDPFQEAVRALSVALDTLRNTDVFTVVSFDHRQIYFRQELVPATMENREAAKLWIRTYEPERGGTDISTPLAWSLDILQERKQGSSMPFVVLVTDGCVSNERDICRYVIETNECIRVLTLGIGTYCNWFFLKMLAQIGRGFDEVVVYKENIYATMVHLLDMASVPVLTDVTLGIAGLEDCELYPFPIPDLFVGAPLCISGKYRGTFPASITLEGVLFNTRSYMMEIETSTSSVMPVSRVFLRKRLDLLTAKAWLEENKELEQEVIAISIAESMPSAYTSMMAYQTSEEEKREEEGADYDSGDDEGGEGRHARRVQRLKNKMINNKKSMALLAAGGAFVVGAALFSFGDLGASAGNLPIGGVDGVGDGGGGDCCDCGDCDCGDCDDCVVC